jgi:hypothetical protein
VRANLGRNLSLAFGLAASLICSPVHASSPRAEAQTAEEGPLPASPKKVRPKHNRTYVNGRALVIVGAVQLVASTALFTGYADAEFPCDFGSIPLSLGAGFMTLGALLMHFGERRRWAAEDLQAGRDLPGPNAPPQGTGMMLGGVLTIAMCDFVVSARLMSVKEN